MARSRRRLASFALALALGAAEARAADVELLVNGNLDAGSSAAWVEVGPWPLVVDGGVLPIPAHTAPFSCWLGGDVGVSDQLHQLVAVPAGTTALTVSGQVWIDSEETGGAVFDVARVQIRSASGSTVLASLATWSNLDEPILGASWHSFSLTLPSPQALAGQSVRLHFESQGDALLRTSFFLDSLSLRATFTPPPPVPVLPRWLVAGLAALLLGALLWQAGRRAPIALAVFLLASEARAEPATPEHVVLLHGLFRSPRSMSGLAEHLEAAGYRTHPIGYPSTELPPNELVAHVAREVERCCADAARLHFVTHSLGGLLVRGYLAKQRPASLGRVVMLAPPNHGSEWVDRYVGNPLFRWVLGPTAVQLGTGPDSLARRLPPADYEVGVIAGTVNRRPGAARVLLGASDGTVSVASTRLHGMTDFVTVPETHTFIMRSDTVAAQVRAFLESGRFALTSAGSNAGTPRAP